MFSSSSEANHNLVRQSLRISKDGIVFLRRSQGALKQRSSDWITPGDVDSLSILIILDKIISFIFVD